MGSNVNSINGKRYSHSNCIASFIRNGSAKGVVSIAFSDNSKVVAAKGNAQGDQGVTDGDYSCKCTVTLLTEYFDQMVVERAAASGTDSWLDLPPENVRISWAQTGKLVRSVELIDFKFLGSDENSEGADPLKVKCECYIRGIIRFPPGCPDGGILPYAGFERVLAEV